ncbi:hypothetical protein GDO81_006643 [Engystomops pustulosus]|uniref:B-cell CLL/lymphoma 7 protein family member B n=1 Tax=Engystomops pustulosus TaxID=76066 RepID=A0AAV7CZX1_ENGPU|nr:hypothetical protein GDO81_006643 [Engystomops pustulosus]
MNRSLRKAPSCHRDPLRVVAVEMGQRCRRRDSVASKEKVKGNAARGNSSANANSSLLLEFQDETSNQSSLSDVYQPKVESSTSSPSPTHSESPSPLHTTDSQPPTLGQESLDDPSGPASEVADEPPTLTKEEPALSAAQAEDPDESGAPPLKRACPDVPSRPPTALKS